MIKVMIKRKALKENEKELLALITQLRSMVSKQPGYISGETLRSSENPEEYLVISIWQTERDWKAWLSTDERADVQGRIDALIGTATQYEIYHYPGKTMTP